MPQQLTVTVVAVVQNPLSMSAPPAGPDPRAIPAGAPGEQYQCVASGGSGGAITFSSPNLPAGWALTPQGLLTRGSVGNYNFTIVVDTP